jgi:hypothetical protein
VDKTEFLQFPDANSTFKSDKVEVFSQLVIGNYQSLQLVGLAELSQLASFWAWGCTIDASGGCAVSAGGYDEMTQ